MSKYNVVGIAEALTTLVELALTQNRQTVMIDRKSTV
jgi:hypothetical protein